MKLDIVFAPWRRADRNPMLKCDSKFLRPCCLQLGKFSVFGKICQAIIIVLHCCCHVIRVSKHGSLHPFSASAMEAPMERVVFIMGDLLFVMQTFSHEVPKVVPTYLVSCYIRLFTALRLVSLWAFSVKGTFVFAQGCESDTFSRNTII